MKFLTASCIAINAAVVVVSTESERMQPQMSPPSVRFRMPFHKRTPLDADTMQEVRSEVRSCANKEMLEDQDDFERAKDAIFHAVEDAEKAVLHAVEDEVDTFFHEMHPKLQKQGDDPMDAAGKRKGMGGKKVQEASCTEVIVGSGGGWRSRCPNCDLREAVEECLNGELE